MPRFDNEGFNPKKRINNDSRDRSVPEDENYYRDFDEEILKPPVRSSRQTENDFLPEVLMDFDRERREKNERNAAKRKRDKPIKKKRKRKPPKGKKILLGAASIFLAIVLVFALMVNSALGKINFDEHKDNRYVQSSDLKSGFLVKNILLLGVDARPDEESESSRADSMMLISIDMKHKCIKMTSFLRDTWVYIPAKSGEQRLNAASTYDGYSGVADTIEYNFGVKIDGYVVADFEMFKVLVDSIGGVEVKVSKKEADEVTNHKKRYANVKLESGTHKLTGEQALAYCRIRKIDTDFMRTKRQRTVIQSILKEIKSANPFTIYKMASRSAPYIETDLTKAQLKRLALSAVFCLGGEMVETRVPFENTWQYSNMGGASVITIDQDKNKEKLFDFIYNKSAEEIKAQEE